MKEQRLRIATELLKGNLIEVPLSGYDPQGFIHAKMRKTIKSALIMAQELLDLNENYGEENGTESTGREHDIFAEPDTESDQVVS